MSEKIVYPYLKSDGFVRPCRMGCPNCTHCTDVWWDYSHGIYGCECDLEEEGPCCDRYENDGTEPVTVEEFNQMKKEEDERIVMSLPPLPWQDFLPWAAEKEECCSDCEHCEWVTCPKMEVDHE